MMTLMCTRSSQVLFEREAVKTVLFLRLRNGSTIFLFEHSIASITHRFLVTVTDDFSFSGGAMSIRRPEVEDRGCAVHMPDEGRSSCLIRYLFVCLLRKMSYNYVQNTQFMVTGTQCAIQCLLLHY